MNDALRKKMKQTRRAKKVSQAKLAETLNCSQQMISGVESGKEKGSIELWEAIGEILGFKIVGIGTEHLEAVLDFEARLEPPSPEPSP